MSLVEVEFPAGGDTGAWHHPQIALRTSAWHWRKLAVVAWSMALLYADHLCLQRLEVDVSVCWLLESDGVRHLWQILGSIVSLIFFILLFIPGVPSLYPGAVWWPWYPSRWRLNIKYIYIKIYAVRNYGSRTLFRAFHNSVLELFNMIIFVWCRRHHTHTVTKVWI